MTASQTCAVTIARPDGRLDVVVPSRTPIGEPIPTFVGPAVVRSADRPRLAPAE
jgi:hypothetical protein